MKNVKGQNEIQKILQFTIHMIFQKMLRIFTKEKLKQKKKFENWHKAVRINLNLFF